MWLFNTIRDWSNGSLCEKLNIFFKIKKKKTFIMVNDRLKKKKKSFSGYKKLFSQWINCQAINTK